MYEYIAIETFTTESPVLQHMPPLKITLKVAKLNAPT